MPLGKIVPVFHSFKFSVTLLPYRAWLSVLLLNLCFCQLYRFLPFKKVLVRWTVGGELGISCLQRHKCQLCPSCSSFPLVFCLVVRWGLLLMVYLSGVEFLSVPIFHFPASRWKECTHLPCHSRAAQAPTYPGARSLWDCRAGLLLLSGSTDMQYLQTSAFPWWTVSSLPSEFLSSFWGALP